MSGMFWEERKPSQAKTLLELVTLTILSLLYAMTVALGVFSWFSESPEDMGFDESLQDALDHYYPDQVAPPRWTYGIWLVIFAWQAGWILHAWSFTVRPTKQRTIHRGLYPTYMLVCALNIGWLYSFCNEQPELTVGLAAVLVLALGICVAFVVRRLYKIYPTLKFFQRADMGMTQIFAVNGLLLYLVWAIINTLLILGNILINSADVHVKTTTTIILSLVASLSLSYFVLENTILDRYLRYTVTVYPAIIWYMAGIVAENSDSIQDDGSERNNLCMIGLTVMAGVLFLLRVVLLVLFQFFRPVTEYEDSFEDIIPN